MVPLSLKYALSDKVRRRRLPYRLVAPGSVVVQVGAPRDTLLSGRSRAMTFVRLAGTRGRVLVIEPDIESVNEFRRIAARKSLHNVEIRCSAAWSTRTTLRVEIDPQHPATNFTLGSAKYDEKELARFREVSVQAAPIDDLLDAADIRTVDLVSITTNGAEVEILRGLTHTIARDRPYICLARTGDRLADIMGHLGYELLGEDDRGFTFESRK